MSTSSDTEKFFKLNKLLIPIKVLYFAFDAGTCLNNQCKLSLKNLNIKLNKKFMFFTY